MCRHIGRLGFVDGVWRNSLKAGREICPFGAKLRKRCLQKTVHRRTQCSRFSANPCALVIIFAVTGFASIAYEVLWFRLLTNFSIQSVYAFSGTSSFLFLAIVVLLLPATLIGISFPLASELTVHRINRLGQRLGLLYGLNTLGGVCGSLLTGFVLLPLLGSQMSFLVIAIASEQPLRIDVDRLRRRMSHPALQKDMAA